MGQGIWLYPKRDDRRFLMQASGYALDQPLHGTHEVLAEHISIHVAKLQPLPQVPAIQAVPVPEGAPAGSNPAITIGGRIRTLRRARGLTQDTLAVSTGVSRSAVAQWETGRAGQMGGKLRRIAEALGVSVSMLKEGWEGLATDSVLSAEEMSLLRMFRRCPPEDRIVLMHVAQKLALNPAGDSAP